MKVEFREDERGRKFPFIDMGSEAHGRASFRLWTNGRFVKKDSNGNMSIEFPVHNARIETTPKGSFVLRPCKHSMVHDIYVPCGYRGGAHFEILSPNIDEDDIFRYSEYRSARGNLGIDEGALVNCPFDTPLKYKWHRTGRLYGDAEEGMTILMPDGVQKELDMLPDGLEAIEELPVIDEAEQSA